VKAGGASTQRYRAPVSSLGEKSDWNNINDRVNSSLAAGNGYGDISRSQNK